MEPASGILRIPNNTFLKVFWYLYANVWWYLYIHLFGLNSSAADLVDAISNFLSLSKYLVIVG